MLGDFFCRVILFINWVAIVQGLIKIPYFLPPLLQTSESNVPYLSLSTEVKSMACLAPKMSGKVSEERESQAASTGS